MDFIGFDLVDGRLTAPRLRPVVRQPGGARYVDVLTLARHTQPRLVGVDDCGAPQASLDLQLRPDEP